MSVLDRFRLDDEVALVTGAAGGIGGAVATAMAEAGAAVALVDVDEEGVSARADAIRDDTGADAIPITADVTEESETERMVAETVETLGGLDVVFANAGIATSGGSAPNFAMAEWDRLMRVNLRGVFLTDKAASAAMQRRGGGRIVNTASVLGIQGTAVPGLTAYAASKGGVVQITRQLAAELGRHDIRVNAMAPGWIQTDMTGGIIPEDDAAGGAIRDRLTEQMAVDRLGQPADLKGTALYLASDASPYTTGEVVVVDGGMTAFQ